MSVKALVNKMFKRNEKITCYFLDSKSGNLRCISAALSDWKKLLETEYRIYSLNTADIKEALACLDDNDLMILTDALRVDCTFRRQFEIRDEINSNGNYLYLDTRGAS